MSSGKLEPLFLEGVMQTLEYQKDLGNRALWQLDEEQLHATIAPGVNCPAVIVRHLAGNIRSRWTDFLTTDGEKPDRNRDSEFVDDGVAKAEVLNRWEGAWRTLMGAITVLSAEELTRTVMIRGQPHSVPRAICRAMEHGAYHVGQLVLIAKILRGDRWQTLTVAPGGSAAFNRSLGFDPANPA